MNNNSRNIVLITTDHFRRDSLGKSTPNIVGLAKEGVRFTNAYCASPLCQPSRNSIITGYYPSQNGVCGNYSDPISDQLRDDTFVNHLKKAGYHTAMIGKHHFIDRYGAAMDITEDHPAVRSYGFDHVCSVVDDGENLLNDDNYTAYLRNKGLLEELRSYDLLPNHNDRNFEHPFAADDTTDGFIGNCGVDFVNSVDLRQPFYLNLSFVGPHPPLWHPGPLQHDPETMGPPSGIENSWDCKCRRAHFMDRCSLIDHYVGLIVDTLKTRNLRENTVVIFTSDHGDMLGDFGIWDKRHFFESSAGVPLVISGPGVVIDDKIDDSRVSRALVSLVDLYPTILGIAGVALPDSMKRPGRDIIAMLREHRGAFHREILCELGTAVMIRTPNWKLVFDPQQGGVQHLFNHANDPIELHNLAGVPGYESIVSELLQGILTHRILLSQKTQFKEEQRLQRVHVGGYI